MELIVSVVFLVILGLVGAWIAGEKGRSGTEGFLLGLLLGPIGCIIEAVLPSRTAPLVGQPGWPAPVTEQRVHTRVIPPPSGLPLPPRVHLYHSEWGGVAGNPDATVDVLRRARAVALDSARMGQVIVEAAWQDSAHSVLGLAFGKSDVAYDRKWPTAENIRELVLSGGEVVSPSVQPAVPGAGAQPARAMKRCPDCAEDVYAEARLCRGCRHDFGAPEDGVPSA